MHLSKVPYYLYLVRSRKRSERADLRVRKSTAILQLVPLARAALATASCVTDCLLPAHYSLLYFLATVYCNEIIN